MLYVQSNFTDLQSTVKSYIEQRTKETKQYGCHRVIVTLPPT